MNDYATMKWWDVTQYIFLGTMLYTLLHIRGKHENITRMSYSCSGQHDEDAAGSGRVGRCSKLRKSDIAHGHHSAYWTYVLSETPRRSSTDAGLKLLKPSGLS